MLTPIHTPGDANPIDPEVFWAEIAPCEHLVQIYQHHGAFLDALEGFVAGGLESGDGVIVIATAEHLASLEERLRNRGHSLNIARASNRYIALDAEETLSRFMIDGWPDDGKFDDLVTTLITRARGGERRVRAFGEMVAVLWGRGSQGATVRLEHLWNAVCQREMFSLFCAYPRSGITQDAEESIREICAAHSRVIAG